MQTASGSGTRPAVSHPAPCAATAPSSDDGNPCTIDSCVEPGGCQHVQTPPNAPCSDGNACTTGDHCDTAGACISGPPTVCNDSRECTSDACVPGRGCVFTARTGA